VRRARAIVGVGIVAAVIAATTHRAGARPDDSNIVRRDYIGPDACGDCHERNHAAWQASLHAAMNRLVGDPGALRGDFSGVRFSYAGGGAVFTRDATGPIMELAGPRGPRRRFRVTRTIGSRYLQEYVGVQIDGPEPREDPIYTTEIRLPFGYWQRAGSWLPRPYFDSWYPAEYRRGGAPAVDVYQPDREAWATRCAWCHNTYPFELRALRATARPVGVGLEQYVELVDDQRRPWARAAIALGNRLPVDELVTVGISCESCHLGGRAHAEGAPIRFVPTSPALRRRAGAPDLAGGRASSVVVNGICAQCHSTPAPRFPDGGASRNSSEALDLAEAACAPAIKCTDCHDPHVAGPGPRAPDAPRHLRACTGCHRALASPAAARAHGRHRDGAASCLDCHMPRIVQGVSDLVRTHRISSPTDPAMLAAAAPNACNLCHLDRSIAWTLDALATGWGRRLEPDASWRRAYGDLDAPVGLVWLGSGRRGARLAAAAAYARSPLGRGALPALAAILDAPVAYDRMWILFAIEDVLGRKLTADEYDPTAPPAVRAAQVGALWSRWLPP